MIASPLVRTPIKSHRIWLGPQSNHTSYWKHVFKSCGNVPASALFRAALRQDDQPRAASCETFGLAAVWRTIEGIVAPKYRTISFTNCACGPRWCNWFFFSLYASTTMRRSALGSRSCPKPVSPPHCVCTCSINTLSLPRQPLHPRKHTNRSFLTIKKTRQ